MHRQIIYPGAIPLETDLLNTNKYTMIALAKLASAIMGSSTYVRGLACTPTSPASMVVNVAAGEIYSLANIDGTAYSSLAADTTHSILKQGYVLDAQSFTLTAPSTSGYSINYLIQVTYADTDGGSTVLPYYNASNPSTAWSGPNNSGTSQYTVRQGLCTVSLKAGVAATTGTQKTPSPDTGYTGLYVITVDQGATTVTAANIAVYANAPFIPSTGLVDGIQRKVMTYAADTGTANAYAAQYVPALLSVTDGTEVEFKARAANTGASTFNPNGLGASPILTLGGNALTGGEIPAGSQVRVKWNATLSSWLIVSASGITVAQTLTNLGLGAGAPAIGIPFFWPSSAMPDTVMPEWSDMVFLKFNNATFSAATYPKLALVYPELKLPEMRGEFLRVWDDGRGVDSGRTLLSAQGDAIRDIIGETFGVNYGAWRDQTGSGAFENVKMYSNNYITSVAQSGSSTDQQFFSRFKASKVVPTANDNRPRNIAWNFLVRAK